MLGLRQGGPGGQEDSMGGDTTTGGRLRGLAIPGLTVAALTIAQGGPGITALGPVRRRLFRRLAGYGDPGHVALTFDDGPDPRSTRGFLDLLARRDIRATFFMLGSMVAAAPGLAAEVAAAGHEIAVHGWDHRYLTLRGPQDTFRDMTRARKVIAETTGQVPVYVRPPYGVLSGGALLAAGRLELRPLLWTCWGREWAPGATPGSVVRTLRRDLGGGGTVLLHDSDATSPSGSARAALGALPWLLDECARRGLVTGPVSEHGLGRGMAAK
jgi:peptidoglycan-N-acetylglucosamine deacetylase